MKTKIYIAILFLSLSAVITVAQCNLSPSMNLPVFADTNGGAVLLTGTPAGGIFSGNGVLFNAFNPIIAGAGIHNITYTYTDTNTGCVYEITESILVFTVIDFWVSYNFGIIQPRLSIEAIVDQSNEYEVSISNINGQILHNENLEISYRQKEYKLSKINLPVGLYIATFRSENHIFSEQFVVR